LPFYINQLRAITAGYIICQNYDGGNPNYGCFTVYNFAVGTLTKPFTINAGALVGGATINGLSPGNFTAGGRTISGIFSFQILTT